jgi:hypothetical protein
MNKLTTFFRTFIQTISNPDYYNDVIKSKFSFSLKYFLVFYLFLSIVTAFHYSIVIKPKLQTLGVNLVDELNNNYPADMVMDFKNGQLSITGAPEPVNLPFPQTVNDLVSSSDYKYLLSVDTQNTPDSQALLTLDKNNFTIHQPDGTQQTIPLSEFHDMTLDKNSLGLTTSVLSSTIAKFIDWSPFLVLLAALVGLTAGSLILLLILSLFTWTVSNILNKHLTYGKSYQLGLHTVTFAETVGLLQKLLFPDFPTARLFGIAFFGSTLFALWALKKNK